MLWLVVHAEATQKKIVTNSKTKWGFFDFKFLQFQGIPDVLDSPHRLTVPTQKCCPARFFFFFNYLYLSGSLEAYQHVWSSTADIWDFVQLSPRLSDLLHVLSLAGTQQLRYLRRGGDFSGTAWKTQDKIWQCCACLAAFCIWWGTGQVWGQGKKGKPSAVGVVGCATSLIALWQSQGFVLLLRGRAAAQGLLCMGFIKPSGTRLEPVGNFALISVAFGFSPSWVILASWFIRQWQPWRSWVKALPSQPQGTFCAGVSGQSQKWAARTWQQQSQVELEHRGLTSFSKGKNKYHQLLCASS